MSYKVKFTQDSKRVFSKLDDSQQIQIRKSILKIENQGMNCGQPLSGKLSDCKKMKHKKLSLRVIFKETEFGIKIIEIVAIGKRDDKEVYDTAVKRLMR